VATKAETLIVKAILTTARGVPGIWIEKIHGGPYQSAGIPDLLGSYEGSFFGVEVKVPGQNTTALQALTIRRIIAAGGRAGVATNVDEALAIITGR